MLFYKYIKLHDRSTIFDSSIMEILLNSSANKTKKFELKMDRFF